MAANSLMSRLLKKAAKDNKVTVLDSSSFFDKDIVFRSKTPLINQMLSGYIDGGVRPGIYLVVGDSRTFKTNFCVDLMGDFLDEDPENIALFFDSEFGAKKCFEARGIDQSRVIHYALENIEDLKFKMTQALDEIDESSAGKVFVFIDSISQIASKKEVENALNENAAADLTRARELNSFFRIITPKLMLKKIPCFAINSYYDSMVNQYAEPTIKGGKQVFLSSDVVLMVTRAQVKDDKELKGWSFNYTAFKSRYVREKSKFSLIVTYEGGIYQNSGLFDWAMESGHLKSEKQGFYQFNLDGFIDGKSYRRKDIEENRQDFFDALVKNAEFKEYVRFKYDLANTAVEEDVGRKPDYQEVDSETGEILS
jgi:RecA/RadA recombinase